MDKTEVKLECVKLAVGRRTEMSDILQVANALFDWITAEKADNPPTVLGQRTDGKDRPSPGKVKTRD